MPVLLDVSDQVKADLRADRVQARHTLHEDPLFSDEEIVALLDSHDRRFIQVYAMGEDPRRPDTFLRGEPGALPGRTLLELVRRGRLWINVRRLETASAGYAAVGDAIVRGVEALRPREATFGWHHKLLISSPNAQVFYHLDPMDIILFQIRGRKRVFIYPNEDAYAAPRDIEAIVLQEKEEELAYQPALDAGAAVATLDPGDWVSWAQFAPHRVVNDPVLNVSISSEYFTRQSRARFGSVFVNGMARRHLKASPTRAGALGASDYARWLLSKPMRAAKLHRPVVGSGAPHFTLDPDRAECVRLTDAGRAACPDWPGVPVDQARA